MSSPTQMSRAAFTKAQLKPVIKPQPAPGGTKPAPLTSPSTDNRARLGVEIKMPDSRDTGSAGARG